MSRKRYVIEGTWSGYRTYQSRICHRTVTKYPDDYQKISQIRFTDGTYMTIQVRPCLKRERIDIMDGYGDLLKKIKAKGLTGCVSVLDVQNSEMV